MFAFRVFRLRVRRTWRDYHMIWRPETRSRLLHLVNCWRASKVLICVDRDKRKIYEVK